MNLPELFSRARPMYHFSEVVQGEKKKKNQIPDIMCLQSSQPAPVFLMFSLRFFATSHVAPGSRSQETPVAKIRIFDWRRRRLPVHTPASVDVSCFCSHTAASRPVINPSLSLLPSVMDFIFFFYFLFIFINNKKTTQNRTKQNI